MGFRGLHLRETLKRRGIYSKQCGKFIWSHCMKIIFFIHFSLIFNIRLLASGQIPLRKLFWRLPLHQRDGNHKTSALVGQVLPNLSLLSTSILFYSYCVSILAKDLNRNCLICYFHGKDLLGKLLARFERLQPFSQKTYSQKIAFLSCDGIG